MIKQGNPIGDLIQGFYGFYIACTPVALHKRFNSFEAVGEYMNLQKVHAASVFGSSNKEK